MPRITTFLTYESRAQEAVEHYVSIFKNSRILRTAYYGEAGPGTTGSVMAIDFELNDQPFTALNGGSHFKFTDGISLSVDCESRPRWTSTGRSSPPAAKRARAAGCATASACGGRSTRPSSARCCGIPIPRRASRVMQAMLKMKKIDIEALKKAFEEGT